jgi:hypothetical protein
MTIKIDLRPEEEKALLERARLTGRDLGAYVHKVLQEHIQTPEPGAGWGEDSRDAALTLEDFIDHDAIALCEKEADDSITLDEVRAATSKIKDSMARVVIEEERAERF